MTWFLSVIDLQVSDMPLLCHLPQTKSSFQSDFMLSPSGVDCEPVLSIQKANVCMFEATLRTLWLISWNLVSVEAGVAGFLRLSGVDLDLISVVCLLMTVGFAVDFTVSAFAWLSLSLLCSNIKAFAGSHCNEKPSLMVC